MEECLYSQQDCTVLYYLLFHFHFLFFSFHVTTLLMCLISFSASSTDSDIDSQEQLYHRRQGSEVTGHFRPDSDGLPAGQWTSSSTCTPLPLCFPLQQMLGRLGVEVVRGSGSPAAALLRGCPPERGDPACRPLTCERDIMKCEWPSL